MTKNQISELLPLGPALFDSYSLHDPISAVMGGVGLIGNVVGGILGKKTANQAGDLQQAAGNAAARSITDATAAANPQIGAAATTAGTGVTTAAGTAAGNALTAAQTAGSGVTAAAGQANALLDPYASAGSQASDTLKAGLVAGGDFNKTPTLQDLQIDPGYAFRLQQGQTQLDRSAAARGGAISGEAIKDSINFGQNSASQEYQNAFQRFQTSTQNRYSNLSGVANRGIAAAGTQAGDITAAAKYSGDTGIQASEFGGQLNTGAAQFAGQADINAADLMAQNSIQGVKTAADYTTTGAAAKAAGMVGGANALTQGISGGVNAGLTAGRDASFLNLLKNPAAANPYFYSGPNPVGVATRGF